MSVEFELPHELCFLHSCPVDLDLQPWRLRRSKIYKAGTQEVGTGEGSVESESDNQSNSKRESKTVHILLVLLLWFNSDSYTPSF